MAKLAYKDLMVKLETQTPLYYHLLLENANSIMLEVAKRGTASVARDLNISQAKFSAIYQVIKEFANDKA